MELRENGIHKPILILGYVDEADMDTIARCHITAPVYDTETARLLSEAAVRTGERIAVHYKLDTGMTRLGFSALGHGADNRADFVVFRSGWAGSRGDFYTLCGFRRRRKAERARRSNISGLRRCATACGRPDSTCLCGIAPTAAQSRVMSRCTAA